jgi:hypothetical protein
VGVTEAVLNTGISSVLAFVANYSGDSPPAAGWQALTSFLNRQDAQTALPVGTDRTTEQSPAALETNDADDT